MLPPGWPVTLLGAELWTCYGVAKEESGNVFTHEITFTFCESIRNGKVMMA